MTLFYCNVLERMEGWSTFTYIAIDVTLITKDLFNVFPPYSNMSQKKKCIDWIVKEVSILLQM